MFRAKSQSQNLIYFLLIFAPFILLNSFLFVATYLKPDSRDVGSEAGS